MTITELIELLRQVRSPEARVFVMDENAVVHRVEALTLETYNPEETGNQPPTLWLKVSAF